jgi:hypothetical protein
MPHLLVKSAGMWEEVADPGKGDLWHNPKLIASMKFV